MYFYKDEKSAQPVCTSFLILYFLFGTITFIVVVNQ